MKLDWNLLCNVRSSIARPSGDSELFSIGDMARAFGVSLRALRFYEDRSLLRPLRNGTTRLYDARARLRLQMILKGKQLGFTLAEIRALLRATGDDALPGFELALQPETGALPAQPAAAPARGARQRHRGAQDDPRAARRGGGEIRGCRLRCEGGVNGGRAKGRDMKPVAADPLTIARPPA